MYASGHFEAEFVDPVTRRPWQCYGRRYRHINRQFHKNAILFEFHSTRGRVQKYWWRHITNNYAMLHKYYNFIPDLNIWIFSIWNLNSLKLKIFMRAHKELVPDAVMQNKTWTCKALKRSHTENILVVHATFLWSFKKRRWGQACAMYAQTKL